MTHLETDASPDPLAGADAPADPSASSGVAASAAAGSDTAVPDADVRAADVPDMDVPGADVPGTDVPGTGADAFEAAASAAPESLAEGNAADSPAQSESPPAGTEHAAAVEPTEDNLPAPSELPEPPAVDVARLEHEGEVAADYLEGLLDIADLDGDIDMDVEGERAVVSIVATEDESGVSSDLSQLVGPNGEVLDALQELTRLAVHQALGERSRLLLDVAAFRARKRVELSEMGRTAAERAASTREPVRLQPMTPFERKVIHDAVAAAGQRSESEGVEPERFVVVLPV